jgi:phytoene dehydrogenase-like protein
VGAGLAGLRCAHLLARAGRSVHVVEAEAVVGGRARTVWHEGAPVDRGFQTILGGYRETARFATEVGIPQRDLRPFSRSVVVHDGMRWRLVGTSPRDLLRLPGVGARDLARLSRLVATVRARAPESWLEEGDERAIDFLRGQGLSDGLIDGLVRPLFGPILLDRTLEADSGYLRFLLGVMARGPALIPSDGVGMLAAWAETALRAEGATLDLGVRVERLEAVSAGPRVDVVRLSDGRELRPGVVVLAVDAPAAERLLEGVDPGAWAALPPERTSCLNAAFALERPLYSGRTLILNSSPDGGAPRVDVLCQTTNVARPGWGGPHVVLATAITTDRDLDPDALPDLVAAHAARLAPGFDWRRHARLIEVVEHRFAHYRPTPGVRRSLPRAESGLMNLVLAGDLTAHPSIEGAVASGVRAATLGRTILASVGGS